MLINKYNTDVFSEKGFPEEEKKLKSYDEVSWFFIQKLKQDLPFAKIDYYTNCRNLRVVTITYDDLTICLELELGYVEFCGIEYDFNLGDIVKLIKAIQYYIIKYTNLDINSVVFINHPWGW